MLKGKSLYQGRSAELAAKSEIIVRGYNVADPEVEVGIDFLVSRPDPGPVAWRVEVKSNRAEWHLPTGEWRAQFPLRPSNVADDALPELIFIFAARILDRWEYIIISRKELLARLPPDKSRPDPYRLLRIHFTLTPTTLHGPGHQIFTPHLNHWDRYWPRHT